MRNFFKKFILLCGVIATISVAFNFAPSNPAFADNKDKKDDRSSACPTFLGMVNWDCNFQKDITSEKILTDNIVIIASNILTDVTIISAYLIIGYVFYGGYLYIFSSGEPAKAAAGKKTLIHAFTGLGITISAYTIFSAIRVAMIGETNMGLCNYAVEACTTPDEMVVNMIQWVAGVGGAVAAAFIVIGGWGYITSAGDANKLQKAKSTILYALIGLLIVIFTEVITAFVSSTIRDANGASSSIYVNTNLIAANIKGEQNEII
jgi:hypothetical protein